jgi:transcriptional regulator with XRE-family HTH domain
MDTREELAKILGVSSNTISKVEKIEEKATEETKKRKRLDNGTITINQAHKAVRSVKN